MNALIFSHQNYCSVIWSKCSGKLQNEVQKFINSAAKVASNWKYLKRDYVARLLKDLKWINFNSILLLNETFKKYFTLQQIQTLKWLTLTSERRYYTENQKRFWCTYRLSKNSQGAKSCLCIRSKAVHGIRPRWISEIQIPSRSKVICTNKSPTSCRTQISIIWELIQNFLNKNQNLFTYFIQCVMTNVVIYCKSIRKMNQSY